MRYVKWLLALVTIGVFVISLLEIISYLKNPSSYMLGSEAMVGNGGFKYKSARTFLLFHSIQIVISISTILLLFKAKGIAIMIIAAMLVLLQVILFVIM